jgi:hypothetical protein
MPEALPSHTPPSSVGSHTQPKSVNDFAAIVDDSIIVGVNA